MKYLCDYRSEDKITHIGANGAVFTTKVTKIDKMPNSEMAEVRQFYSLPHNLTCSKITPKLFTYFQENVEK